MRMKCAFSRFSSSGTPQPTLVSQSMTDGRADGGGPASATASKAASSASTSLPSTRWTYQPKAAHLSCDRLDAQHAGGGAVGLQGVDVDHAR